MCRETKAANAASERSRAFSLTHAISSFMYHHMAADGKSEQNCFQLGPRGPTAPEKYRYSLKPCRIIFHRIASETSPRPEF